MTVALAVKVQNGVVLASDSAATLAVADGVERVYNNANKIFNLHKGLPIGMATWGIGALGHSSISTLAKDLRTELTEGKKELSSGEYTISEVAKHVEKFMGAYYEEEFDEGDLEKCPPLGFYITGYSAGEPLAETYLVQWPRQPDQDPAHISKQEEYGVLWSGQTDAISRVLTGFSEDMPDVLRQKLGVPGDEVDSAIKVMRNYLKEELVFPGMPIQDAIDLARFLVELTENFYRFRPGAPTVGGPIEIASITKHEGFKWIQRKHYFPQDLNPKRVGEK